MTPSGSPQLDLSRLDQIEGVSLCEALDRVLNKGAVVAGEVTIAVADIELVYLGLEVVLSSVETARGAGLSLSIGKERGDASRGDGTAGV